MSSSSSSSATQHSNRDGRVAGDNGAIGVSAEGNVSVNVVPDEAFYLGEFAIEAIKEMAGEVTTGSKDTITDVTDKYAEALAVTQEKARTEATQLAESVIKLGLPLAALAYTASKIWGK